ncbi:hypothetical protein HHK36_008849 [Tetracentron sinense]|uniref:Protein kinase domain-containing protein n=1 Tax=Tetracentron sinense TaxID=13715 RepID=A0A835DNL1_TETSI|nr:hypothetical protein HHK36_008849 [Tetracentron sinense]
MFSGLRAAMKLKRQSKDEEESERFLMHGGLLLEELIASCDGNSNPIRIFSSKELNKATKNYDSHHRICRGHDEVMFRGSLEGRTISVKKASGLPWSINEIVVASQMSSHKNVLKLLGCCLETEIPTPVFEFVGKTTLSDHIHGRSYPVLSWENKLRIATEIADAVTYLHTALPKSIIHRDIKPSNVFLDDQHYYAAKLSGFSLSIPIPLGEADVEANIAGTIGFLAPEAVMTGRFAEKSDVYGFGALLLEILTGKKAWDSRWDELGEAQLLLNQAMDINTTEQFLKANIMIQGNAEQSILACEALSLRCLKQNPEERPTMKEVAKELRRIQKATDDPSFKSSIR